MKGIVFTEFLEMVSNKFGESVVDDIIDAGQLGSNGAYTSVGTYPHEELVALVVALSKSSKVSIEVLVHTFGYHLFGRFFQIYPRFFTGTSDAITFLAGIEKIIHAEVRKLYPDAQLPHFQIVDHTPTSVTLIYESGRKMGGLAHGLIDGCVAHFGGGYLVSRKPLTESEHLERTRFTVTAN